MREPADEPPPLLRVVLDTNVYVSGTILSRGTPFEVLEAWQRQAYILVTSEAILAEIERVLRYPRIRDRYTVSERDVERLVESLRADALIVPGDCQVTGVCADPDDDKFFACALEAQADCIVTGDPDLLNLGRYQGVDILKPHEFLERLR
ncbi:MAG: putative toxin-antitoxin system toxin component, PIN family [Chloroflexota bacterium]